MADRQRLGVKRTLLSPTVPAIKPSKPITQTPGNRNRALGPLTQATASELALHSSNLTNPTSNLQSPTPPKLANRAPIENEGDLGSSGLIDQDFSMAMEPQSPRSSRRYTHGD